MGELHVPVQSVTGFEACGIRGSVRAFLFLFGVLRILAAPAAAVLLCALASLIRKEPAVIASAAILIAVTAWIAGRLPVFSPYFLVSALSGVSAAKQYALPDLLFLIFFLLLKTSIFCCAAELSAAKPHR